MTVLRWCHFQAARAATAWTPVMWSVLSSDSELLMADSCECRWTKYHPMRTWKLSIFQVQKISPSFVKFWTPSSCNASKHPVPFCNLREEQSGHGERERERERMCINRWLVFWSDGQSGFCPAVCSVRDRESGTMYEGDVSVPLRGVKCSEARLRKRTTH